MGSEISTRFLILSDTHGEQLNHHLDGTFDVAIHCGDLTEESKLKEFEATLSLLKQIDAPLKLVIAGNHDFSLDIPTFQEKSELFKSSCDGDIALLDREFGPIGEARRLLESKASKDAGIKFLDEGVHKFSLANGALLTVYASPFTPSKEGGMAFQYNPKKEHEWNLDNSVDVVITHGPPHGILDYTPEGRAGSSSLFRAVARAKPRLHCFGHIHESWGAKLVAWREEVTENPTHFTAIDNDESAVIEALSSLRPRKFDTTEVMEEKRTRRNALDKRGYAAVETSTQSKTLFVNAAIEGPADDLQQWPWSVNIKLPKAGNKRRLSDGGPVKTEKTNKKTRVDV